MGKLTFKTKLITSIFAGFVFSALNVYAASDMSEAESRVAREKLITEAKKYIGSPYVRGAVGPDTFDCSGLVYHVARESIHLQLPRTVKAMYSFANIIPDAKREPGDLVFFRTTGDNSISHVGIYVGNSQFISAASDGPNTGVILSSLKEKYWGSHYAVSGKIIDDTGWYEDEPVIAKTSAQSKPSSSSSAKKSNSRSSSSKSKSGKNKGFVNNLWANATLSGDWSLFTEKRFMPNFRGLTNQINVYYEGDMLSPGAGTYFRWNFGVGAFQIALPFSLTFNDYVRVYAGPVFTIGKCYLPDTDYEIKSSIFPGIIGVSFMAPSFTKGNLKIQLMQDICYSVFNNTDGAALSAVESLAAGLEFGTGISVTMPFNYLF